MAMDFTKDWSYEISFKDIFDLYRAKEIEPTELGKLVAKRILGHPIYKIFQNQLDPIISGFEDIRDIDDFDSCMEDLYDWADRNKRCWIGTF